MRILPFTLFIFLSFLLSGSIGYSKEHSLHCSPELRGVLGKIQTHPEGSDLLCKVLEQGPLYIELNRAYSNQFEGYWVSNYRTIYISKTRKSSECNLITTLLFELHNALRTADLEHMYSLASNNAIEREEFIQAVEYIEYENAYATSKLLDQGAVDGIFPCDCWWNLSDNFDEHLYIQQKGGHSAWIGNIYDKLVS